jgi:hypothetical protein
VRQQRIASAQIAKSMVLLERDSQRWSDWSVVMMSVVVIARSSGA